MKRQCLFSLKNDVKKKKKKNVINQSFIDPLRDEKNGLANELISGLIWGPDC